MGNLVAVNIPLGKKTFAEEIFANLSLIRKIKFREIYQNSSIRENFFHEINHNSPFAKKFNSMKIYIFLKKMEIRCHKENIKSRI